MKLEFLAFLCFSQLILGQVLTLKEAEEFIEEPSICNLNGQYIRAIAVNDGIFMSINTKNLTFDPKLKAYNATNNANGMMVDIIQNLAISCNFTYDIYLTKNGTYGTIRKLNGTLEKSGLFSYLSEDFPLILSDIAVTYERSQHVQFLHHFAQDYLALAISNDLGKILDFKLFWSPLSFEVWIALIILCIFPAILMSAQDALLTKEKFKWFNFLSRMIESFAANFGGNFLASKSCSNSQQFVIFSYFINGIIIWITYRASIVAVLSVENFQLPFSDLAELSHSDYLLMTLKQSSAAFEFIDSSSGSVERKVFEKNFDAEKSLVKNLEEGVRNLESKRALYYYYVQLVKTMRNRKCHFKFVYKKSEPRKIAMVVRKGEPRFKRLNFAMKKMDGSGHLQRIRNKYGYIDQYHCQNNQHSVSSIGLNKLVSIFIYYVGIGIIFSCFVMILEILFKSRIKIA